jgi:hypothetical protein
MRIYQFLFFDPRGASPALDFSDCPDDRAAALEAFGALSRHNTCVGVEVFDGDRLVTRVERPLGATRFAASQPCR